MEFKHAWKVRLIPWDHTSEEQVTRLYEQRVACGWRADEVASYVESANKGGRVFYWVMLTDTVPDRDTVLETHVKAFPNEATPLRDTASVVRLLPRVPSKEEFVPIGHVALEIHLPEEDAKLGLPSSGVVWIHQLYVSYALQQHGFGAAAMDQVEVTAREEIFKGRMLVLDTIQEEMQMSPEGKKHLYAERGVPIPRVSTQSWYARRGYEILILSKEDYVWDYGAGSLTLPIAYMRKMLD